MGIIGELCPLNSSKTVKVTNRGNFAFLASHLADQESATMFGTALNIHEPQESRSCRTDTFHCDEEDANPL